MVQTIPCKSIGLSIWRILKQNSNKKFELEPVVFEDVLNQRLSGNSNIAGVMIESHLNSGNQTLNENEPEKLEYGVSITDSCLGWEQTEKLLLNACEKLRWNLASNIFS